MGWRALGGVHRVASRPAAGAPDLTRLPGSWWTASPQVQVRRRGLGLELGLRDNLERVLYATGTYEPPRDSAAKLRAAADRDRLDVTVVEAALQGMAGALGRLRPRALVVEVKQRVLDRAGVDGDEIRKLLGRLGYEPTGQVLPVANEVYRVRAGGWNG